MKRLNQHVDERKYHDAYTLIDQLFQIDLKKTQKKQLLDTCHDLLKLKPETVGNDFYAYMRTMVTLDLQSKKRPKANDIIKGYEEALELGNSAAGYNLAVYYKKAKKGKELVKATWEKCALKFPTKAVFCNEVGKCYQYGYGTNEDIQEAKRWYEKGAALNHANCTTNLAYLLQSTPSKSKQIRSDVIELYKRAEALGSARAAFNLGVIFQSGWYKTDQDGKELTDIQHVDLVKAEEYFREAYLMCCDQLADPEKYTDPDDPFGYSTADLKEDMVDSMMAIMEILVDDKGRDSPDRQMEIKSFLHIAKKHKRDVSEIEQKIAAANVATGQVEDPPAASKAPMKSLMHELFREEESDIARKGIANALLNLVAAKAPAAKAPMSRSVPVTPYDKDIETTVEQAKDEPENHELIFKLWCLEQKAKQHLKNNN
ncbi:MAG: sel1 repeat family protein [Verrucomicrobia bacterium]|nr:sel1 repeat family protein [Verrucomicrobiota bacterium]